LTSGVSGFERRSGRVFVFVDEAAEEVGALELQMGWRSERSRAPACLLRRAECKRAVRPMAVVMVATCSSWRRLKISSRSRHSRRTLPIQRSACAFAFGACTGVRITVIPSALENVIAAAAELGVAIVDQQCACNPSRRSHAPDERSGWRSRWAAEDARGDGLAAAPKKRPMPATKRPRAHHETGPPLAPSRRLAAAKNARSAVV
jgi:hypothetical protein